MHFEALKVWTVVDVPDPFALLDLDTQQTKVVNGDDGGTWNPTYPIVLGGAGVVVGGPSSFSSASGFTDGSCNASIGGTASVPNHGFVSFKAGSIWNFNASSVIEWQSGANVTWANQIYAASSQLTLTCTLTGAVDFFNFTPTFASGAAWNFGSGSACSFLGAAWNQSGGTQWNGTVAYTALGSITRKGQAILSGSHATTTFRYGGASNDGNATYDGSFDAYVVPSLSAACRYTLAASNSLDGQRLTFTCLVHGSMPAVSFVRPDGTTAATSPTTGPWWVTFEFSLFTSSWHAYAWNSGDTITQSQN